MIFLSPIALLVAATAVGTLALPATALGAPAAGHEPAGGAALAEVLLATGGALVATAVLFWLGWTHRSGRTRVLARAAAFVERHEGLPGWAALPGLVAMLALLVAVVGMYWDISLHIDQGRDAGPLANPAHYLILIGLFGVFAAGVLAMVLPEGKPGRTSIEIAPSWHVPLGGLLIAASAGFALIGFPLDDLWHRLFGQDVTLWGPTHLMLFGGASATLVGRCILLVEGIRAGREQGDVPTRRSRSLVSVQRATLAGAFLIGLSTFQGEFDFGVPQFSLLFQPVLVMIAAGGALVLARIWAGPGGALGAVALFIAIRGLLAVLVGPVFGETLPHFPTYVVAAIVVESVALFVKPSRPLRFGVVAGLGIGTLGLAAEWAWSQIWMPIPWQTSMLPEAAILGLAAALAGSTIGALLGAALASDRVTMPRSAAPALGTSAVVIALIVAFLLPTTVDSGVTATVELNETRGGDNRAATARVAIDPPRAAEDADWLTITAWQGGGLVVDRLEQVEPGVYRTSGEIPLHGSWKSLVRLHSGRAMQAAPVYLPADAAIPAPEVPAPQRFTRQFVADKEILQREAREAAGWITTAAHLAVLACFLVLLALLAWGSRRIALDGPANEPPAPEAPPRRHQQVPIPGPAS